MANSGVGETLCYYLRRTSPDEQKAHAGALYRSAACVDTPAHRRLAEAREDFVRWEPLDIQRFPEKA